MLEANDYPSKEQMVHLDWHHAGLFDNPAANVRAAFYGASAAPDVYFDGIDNVLGAGADSIATYNLYKPIVDDHYLNDPAKATVAALLDINSDSDSATITVDLQVTAGDTLGNPSGCKIYAALYEDNIITQFPDDEPQTNRTEWDYIARLMMTEVTLTASLPGETQQVIQKVAINSSWKPRDLHAVAWAQRSGNKQVIQAAQALTQYDCNVVNLDPLVASSVAGVTDFDTQLTYTGGADDDVVLTLDETALPGGWDAEIVWNSTSYASTVTIPDMTASQMENVAIRVTPSGPAGVGTVSFTAHPASNSSDAVGSAFTYHVFFQTPSILFVDDDNGAAHESFFVDAILGAGFFSVTNDVTVDGNPPLAEMADYDAVVWTTGELPTNTIGAGIQNVIKNYLDGGGAFFLSSQGYLNHQGLTSFTTGYLGVASFTSNTGAASATGVGGDPIGDGLSFALAPPYTDAADAVVPGLGTTWLESGANDIGVRYDSGVFRTVFMSAAFEGIGAPDDDLTMDRILTWLLPNSAVDARTVVAPPGGRLALSANVPNPFRGATSLRFALPSAGHVELSVYDVGGRKVRGLVQGRLEAGSHAVEWDGRDGSGARVASGVYLVRLNAAGETRSREVVRVE
jgi:hypothetical protein